MFELTRPIHVLGRFCKRIELTSSNSSLQEALKMTGTYEIQTSKTPARKTMHTTYYNSEQKTYILLSSEEIEELEVEGGIWMVRMF